MSDVGRIEYSPTYDYGTGMGKPCKVVVTPATDTYYYAAECPDCSALRARVAELEAERDALRAEALVLRTLVDVATPIDEPPVDLAPLTAATAERWKAMERVALMVDCTEWPFSENGFVLVGRPWWEDLKHTAAIAGKGEE